MQENWISESCHRQPLTHTHKHAEIHFEICREIVRHTVKRSDCGSSYFHLKLLWSEKYMEDIHASMFSFFKQILSAKKKNRFGKTNLILFCLKWMPRTHDQCCESVLTSVRIAMSFLLECTNEYLYSTFHKWYKIWLDTQNNNTKVIK